MSTVSDRIIDGAIAVLRGWRNDGADGESAHLVCDALKQCRRDRDDNKAALDALLAQLNAPEIHDFVRGVAKESVHQRERWGSDHDAGKTPQDWFWLVGYLCGKALAAHIAGNTEKALHHTISTAAAMANWHAAILGKTDMRPGIMPPVEIGDVL